MSEIRTWPRLGRIAVIGVAVGGFVASCSSDASESSSTAADSTTAITTAATTAPTAVTETAATDGASATSGDVCADREALRSSVDDLKNVDIRAEGTNGLNAAIDSVKSALASLRSSAGAELRPQVDAVQGSIDSLQTAADNLGSGGAPAAAAAVSDLAESTQTLLGTLESGACGASTTPTT